MIPSGIIPAPCLKVEEFIPESQHAHASYVHLGTTWRMAPYTTTTAAAAATWQVALKDYTITQTPQAAVGPHYDSAVTPNIFNSLYAKDLISGPVSAQLLYTKRKCLYKDVRVPLSLA